MTDNREKAPSRVILITKIVIVVFLLGLITYDVFVAVNPFRGDTISEITLWASLKSFTLTAALGYIAGHLTWPAKHRNPMAFVLFANFSLFFLFLTVDLFTWAGVVHSDFLNFLRKWPPLVFLPCYVLGRLFWPQVRMSK